MRFGTYYFLQAPPSISHPDVVRREIEQMVWTEELGFDSVWLTEHHFIEYGLSVSPAVLAAAAAMRTRHVRIGLAAAILPFHDPVRLAEELAIVDILSEGRLDVGVGRGNRPVEFEGYRVPQLENRERFDECLAIMLRRGPPSGSRSRGATSRSLKFGSSRSRSSSRIRHSTSCARARIRSRRPRCGASPCSTRSSAAASSSSPGAATRT
jgi:alkanesulfonate monooxygenase SsuD/methylene tetrahydromethanopterin reductase-like flavin-dependent oxidoreductase (luciferase family)